MTDTDYTKDPICPYCAHKMQDAWELNMYDGDVTEIDCDCGETYLVTMHVTVEYSTYRKEKNNEPY
jgi:hypothetical protein